MQHTPIRLKCFISLNNGISFSSDAQRLVSDYLKDLELYLYGENKSYFLGKNEHKQQPELSGYYCYWAFSLFVPAKGGEVLVFPKSQIICEKLAVIKDSFIQCKNSQWRTAPITEMDLIWNEILELQTV